MSTRIHPVFPTTLHEDASFVVCNFFRRLSEIDTVLLVNSCARGQATAESDLDFAILAKEDLPAEEKIKLEREWKKFADADPVIRKFLISSRFANIHLDVIDGKYSSGLIGKGEPVDSFELEIGNQLCYSAPMHDPGTYFNLLKEKWLPYYSELLRKERIEQLTEACYYDLDYLLFTKKRELHFHALYLLNKVFQEYLQLLFITNKIYPLAYNKWILYQVTELLQKPDLYTDLPHLLSVGDIEGNDVLEKVDIFRKLLENI
jgi:predicted nucleotidyltransferase